MFELHWTHPLHGAAGVDSEQRMIASHHKWTLYAIATLLAERGAIEMYCVVHGKVFKGYEILNTGHDDMMQQLGAV